MVTRKGSFRRFQYLRGTGEEDQHVDELALPLTLHPPNPDNGKNKDPDIEDYVIYIGIPDSNLVELIWPGCPIFVDLRSVLKYDRKYLSGVSQNLWLQV